MRTSMALLAAYASYPAVRLSSAFTPCMRRSHRLISSTTLRLSSLDQNNEDTVAEISPSSLSSPSPGQSANTTTPFPCTKSIKGVIFDMDGTLIKPCIDFAGMRRRIYEIADADPLFKDKPEHHRRGDVLELYTYFSESGQAAAKNVFDDIEAKALRDMTLMPRIGELCSYLDGRGISRAVLTRNVGKSIEVMQHKLWDNENVKEFFPVVHRETIGSDGSVVEMKPSPDAIFHICDIWGCDPMDVLMVGDSVADDIVAANRAGCGGSVLLNFNGREWDNDSGAGNVWEKKTSERQPSSVIHDLGDLREILEAN